MSFRIGLGYDVHPFEEGRELILGGVKIDSKKGLKGHSDADVLLHSITDALLGSLALGDIGTHFPDTDPAFKDADSSLLLQKSYRLIKDHGYILVNADVTVIAENPKLNPYIDNIRKRVAEILNCLESQISIKATTSEKMGFVGREEGIAVHAIVLVEDKG
jgi:2-C-methyl-D-erythritol 2,4-cyclodiphosphate synthase